MAAVLVVALLLLCGKVQSAEEGAGAYVTQVILSSMTAPTAAPTLAISITNATEGSDTTHSAVLSTVEQGPAASPVMAPAITTTTEGSDTTHSAVLSTVEQGQDTDLVLVDLARAVDEKFINVASAPEPSPSANSIPVGFDMVEPEAPAQPPYIEKNAPEAAAAGSDSGTSFATDSSQQGQLLTGDYPTIDDKDHSGGAGYGVQSYEGGGADGQSFAAVDAGTSFAADSSSQQGQLLTGDYPTIDDKDHSGGAGYGVQSYGGGGADGQSFAAADAGTSFAADFSSQQGQLLTGDYPTIDDKDHSGGAGYGVQSYGGGGADGQSFAAADAGTSFAADFSSQQGQLLTGDYPTIDDKDHSGGAGYGVQSYGGGGADGQSFAAADAGTSFAADFSSQQGQLLTGDYPTIDDKDHSGGAGYGVQSYGGGGADGQSFAAMGGDNASAKSESNASNTAGFALGKSQTYTRGPNSRETWGKGKCTFYGGMDASGTMSGACGYGNLYASGYGAYSAALSSALFKNGMACGACYEVACSGAKSCKPGSVLVSITNFCPPNPGRSADNGGWCNGANQHFDLSYPAFAKIADPKAGVVPLNYRRVPCKKHGGIRFTLNGNCNFNLLTITNVGGSGVVTEVYLKGDKTDWAPMSRNWGANWQCSRNYCGKGISVKVITSDKKVSVSRLAGPEWAFGKTYIGQQVY